MPREALSETETGKVSFDLESIFRLKRGLDLRGNRGRVTRLREEMANGLAVVGVSMDSDGWKSVRPYLKEKNVNYSIVIGNEEIAKRCGVEA